MKRFAFTLAAAALLSFTVAVAPATAEPPDLPADAAAFAQRLLDHFDQGDFAATYDMTDPVLDLSRFEYLNMVSEREIMGDAPSRELESVEETAKHADLPKGEYLKVTYHTAFEKDPEAREIVVLSKLEGEYRLAGYQIQYNRWPEAIKMIGNGLFIVFFIMILLAGLTHFVGKAVQASEKRKKAQAKAAQEKEKDK